MNQDTAKVNKQRKIGIEVVGHAPWGTHFCQFYRTKEDLLDTLIPYFKSGLENNEMCVLVASDFLNKEDIIDRFNKSIPSFSEYLSRGQIEIFPHTEWYLRGGSFDLNRTLNMWLEKYMEAMAKGYEGLRVSGNPYWIDNKKDWDDFAQYESKIDNAIKNYNLLVLCTYSLEKCAPDEIIDVIQNHQFALIKRSEKWELVKGSAQIEAEQQGKKAAAVWQRTFDSITDIAFVQDKDFTIIKANKAVLDALKIEEKDIIGKKCFEVLHKSSRPWINCPFEKTRIDKKSHTEEICDPKLGFMLVTTSPIFDENGEFSGSIHIAKDINNQKRVEQTIREANDRLAASQILLQKKAEENQTIIDSVPAMVFYKDKENRFVRTNNFFEETMKMKKQDLEGKSLFEIYPRDQAEAYLKDDLEVINSGKPKRNIIETLKTPNGIRFVQTDKIPHFDENGEVAGIVGFAVDITERKKAEEAIIASETRYRRLFEAAKDGIIILNAETGVIEEINPFLVTLLGYKKEQLLAKKIWEIGFLKDIVANKDNFLELQKKGYVRYENMPLQTADDRSINVEFVSNVYLINENKVIQCNIRDITARKKAEEALRKKAEDLAKSEEKYRELADSISDPFTAYDSNLRCVFRNKSSEKNTLIPKEQAIGKTFEELHPELIGSEIHKAYLHSLKNREPKVLQTEWHHEDKETTYHEMNIYPAKDGGIAIISRNITEQKKFEKELKRLASFPERNPYPVMELDIEGKIIYVNPTIKKIFPSLLSEGLRHPWLTNWEQLKLELLKSKNEKLSREINVGKSYYQQMIHYLKDQKRVRIYAIDITQIKEKEESLNKFNRTLKALSKSNQILMRVTDELTYLKEVCQIIVEDCGYKMVWIGYAQDDDKKSIKPMASAGFEEGYLETLNLTWADKELGRGPTGTAIRTGQITTCQNILTDPKFAPWKEEALRRGYNSSIVFPMIENEKTFGAINIYSELPSPFLKEEIDLLNELASDVTYGISSLKTNQARLRAEEELQKSETKLQTEKNILSSIMHNSQSGLAYVDRDFNFVSVNSVFCKNNGRAEEELIGKNYFDFFPSEENRLLFEKVVNTGLHVESKQKPLVFKNQPWREITYWDWTITPVKNSDGFVYGLVISLVDVSESVKSIENLKLHGQKLEQITGELKKVQTAVENASDIIFITDNKGKIIYINKAVKALLGYRQKELIGRKPNFWMENMPNKFFAQMWNSIYFNKKPFIGEIKDRKKNGEIFIAEIRIAPVLDKNGQILSFVGIERDITEEKRLDLAKTEFISLAAHQLRTPITTVSLTAEMLLGGLSGKMDKDTSAYLNDIIEGIKKMSEMIELFLNVSRIEMRTFEIMPGPVNIAQTIESNIKSLMPQINNKNLEIQKNIPADLPVTSFDSKVLNIVIENLLSNAIKYTPSKGIVSVEAEKYRDEIIIKISDTGHGIPKNQQSKIFEKLFRAENTKDTAEGIGLGLYLSKSLIDQAGGKIWLKSEENKGATFFVSIPFKARPGK